jgi:hypothetical protein
VANTPSHTVDTEAFSPGIKWQGRGAKFSNPSDAKIKNAFT